jgi:hypothetical protein
MFLQCRFAKFKVVRHELKNFQPCFGRLNKVSTSHQSGSSRLKRTEKVEHSKITTIGLNFMCQRAFDGEV